MPLPPLCPCDAPWTDEYRESRGRRLDPEYDDDCDEDNDPPEDED